MAKNRSISIAILAFFAILVALLIPDGRQGISATLPPGSFGLKEGDALTSHHADGDNNIYVVNEHGYKRLFINPAVYLSYGHLGFGKEKQVTIIVRDAFTTANLYRLCETGDQRVWALEMTSPDTAVLHWVNISGNSANAQDPEFFKKIFCINQKEAGNYTYGSDYSSVNQIPGYSSGLAPTASPTPSISGTMSPSPSASMSPSPTISPTISPTMSPTISPTISPTPSPTST